MRAKFVPILCLAATVLAVSNALEAFAHHVHQAAPRTIHSLHGVAVIRSEQSISGTLYFDQQFHYGAAVHITGELKGLSDGDHGFHVHRWGNFTQKCDSAGPHFNPDWLPHGGPKDHYRHVGDLGNVQDGKVNFTDHHISLSGRNSIFGRAVVIHMMPDDLGKSDAPDSRVTGNAGAKIACGIVGKRQYDLGYANY